MASSTIVIVLQHDQKSFQCVTFYVLKLNPAGTSIWRLLIEP